LDSLLATFGSARENMNKKTKNISLFFSIAALSCCFFVCSCVNDTKQIEELTRKKVLVDEGKNIVSYLSQKGELKAKLTAPIMNRYATDKTDTVYFEFPNSLHADFYDSTAKRESWLDAKHARYFQTLNKVYLWDSVVVINLKGDTLKSPDLWWDQNTKRFYTDKIADYRTKTQKFIGRKGAEATQDLTYIIFKETTGSVLVTDSGLPSDSTR
jgi:LPS export ABC transporter protein LptC